MSEASKIWQREPVDCEDFFERIADDAAKETDKKFEKEERGMLSVPKEFSPW